MDPVIKCIKRNLISSNKWIQHYFDDVMFPNGKTGKYNDIVENNGKPGCVIIAENEKKEICFIKSYRYPTQQYMIELPRGASDKALEDIDHAKYELKEETGYQAGVIESLGKLYPNSGISSSFINVFHATNLHYIGINPEKTEAIKSVTFYSRESVKSMIVENKLCDSISLAACLMLFVKYD